jgi:hypothetical protein
MVVPEVAKTTTVLRRIPDIWLREITDGKNGPPRSKRCPLLLPFLPDGRAPVTIALVPVLRLQ